MRKSVLRCLAALLCAAALTSSAKAAAFPDVAAGSWYEAAVTEMAAEGLLRGYPNGNFGPRDPITAAQLVTIAARCAGLEPGEGENSHWAAGSLAAALEAGWYDWDELPPTGESWDTLQQSITESGGAAQQMADAMVELELDQAEPV